MFQQIRQSIPRDVDANWRDGANWALSAAQSHEITRVYICAPSRPTREFTACDITTNAKQYCMLAIKNGCLPISPLLYFEQILSDRYEREFFKKFSMELLSECDELWQFGEPNETMLGELVEAKRRGIRIVKFN